MADGAPFVAALLSRGGGASQHSALGGTQAALSGRQLVLEHGQEVVLDELQQLAGAASPAAAKAVRAVLLSTRASTLGAAPLSPQDAAACRGLRSALCGQLPGWVHGLPAEEAQLAGELVGALLPELEHLPGSDVAALLSAALSGMEAKQQHCCVLLELLPACLAALAAAPPDDAGDSQAGAAAGAAATSDDERAAAAAANAAQHRDSALHRLSHCQWQPEQVGQVVAVLKGLPMSQQQLRKLLDKALQACRVAGLQQLPPVLYQLLLLAAAVPGTRCYALQRIVALFDHLEHNCGHNTRSSSSGGGGGGAAAAALPGGNAQPQAARAGAVLPSATLLQVQATLLMHVSTLLKYDAALGSEWLKWLSKEAGAPNTNHFLLQVLLSMARHRKLEQQVQQLLKRWVAEACEQDAGSGGCSGGGGGVSGWMASLQPVNPGPDMQQLEAGLLKAVRASIYASELVAPGVLQLASNLLATHCSSPLHVVLAATQAGPAGPPQHAPPAARSVRLGLLLLQQVFEAHAEARGEVLKVVQTQLCCANLDAALPTVLLLSSLCRTQPALLASYVPQLKDCLAVFAGLSLDTAMALLLALWPLCRVRGDLQDYVTMLLRKMMYRQDVAGRLVSVRGFVLLILQHLRDSGLGAALPAPPDPGAAGCSQASLSQMSSLSGSRGVNLLQELAGVLRRALSQQAPVREALYTGLLQVLEADPGSTELLAELLLPHARSFMAEDEQELPPLQLHRCAELGHGQTEPVLLEPLPALLSCVRRLARRRRPGGGAGGLGGSEQQWPGGEAPEQEDSSTAALQACFASLRTRLARCHVDHFDLGCAADLSPVQPEGLLRQLHTSSLLGVLEVAIEDAVGDALRLRGAQPDADARDGDEVNRLGEELLSLFELHGAAYTLALEGAKTGSKKGRKPGGGGAGASTAGDAAAGQGGTAATAGTKRARPAGSYTPVHRRRPHLSAACLAQLCNAIADDGLLALPSAYAASHGSHHVALARGACFRAAVLRSCGNALEAAQDAAATSVLLQQQGAAASAAPGGQAGDGAAVGAGAAAATGAAAAGAEVLQLGPALFRVVKMVMTTATAGGRPSRPAAASNAGAERKAAAAAGEGQETLEQLSAAALLQLLRLADATQQLGPLFRALPLTDGSFPAHEQPEDEGGPEAMQVDGAAAAGGGARQQQQQQQQQPGAAARAVAAAVLPRLPQLLACADRLMQQGCFREAQTVIEALMLLGPRLGAPTPAPPAAAGQPGGAAAAAGQQQAEPAFSELSRWAHGALQQTEPEVKSLPLVRGLLELYIRFHGTDAVIPLKLTIQAIQEVVGDTDGETQETQAHSTILPLLMSTKTAQPAAATPLLVLEEALQQLERLASTSLKGGVVQDTDSLAMAKARRKLAAAICKRLQELLGCLRVLLSTVLAMPSVMDCQTRVATRAYKLLAQLAKAHQLPKRPAGSAASAAQQQGAAAGEATAGGGAAAAARALGPEFEALVGFVHRELTPALCGAIRDLTMLEGDVTLATLSRVRKDAKLMPALVYALEAWEKQLVATGKAAAKNLLRDAKRTFCRDFKLKSSSAAGAAGAAGAAAGAAGPGAAAAAAGQAGRQHGRGARPSDSRGSTGSGAEEQQEAGDEGEEDEAAAQHEGEEEAEEEDADAAGGENQQQQGAEPAETPGYWGFGGQQPQRHGAVGADKGSGAKARAPRPPLHHRQG